MENGRQEGCFTKTVLAASVDGIFSLILHLMTIENDVVCNLTVREDVISRHVKVMRTVRLFSLHFMCFSVHFQL